MPAITRVPVEGQSRAMSLVEAATNIVVGYGLAILTQIFVFPHFEIEVGLSEHLMIGLIFATVSLVRGYVLRRLFEGCRPQKSGPAQGPALVLAGRVAPEVPLGAAEVLRAQDLFFQPDVGA